MIGNPAYGDATGASEGGASTTSSGPVATTSTTTTTTSESGGSGTGEAATSTGEISASAGSGTGGSSTGEGTTGEASTGEASTGGPFCAPDVQMSAMCEPLADTGLLVCEALTSWAAARASCEAVCGRLAVIHDDAARMKVHMALRDRMTPDDLAQEALIEQQMMGDQATMPRASYWLGASTAGPNLDYGWLDGTLLPAQKGANGWGPNDPDYSGLCVVLGVWGKGADDGKLFDRGCDSDTYRYVCDPG